jgi:hypothetical protein
MVVYEFRSIDDVVRFASSTRGLSIYAIALTSRSADANRHLEIHRNHAGYYFVASIQPRRGSPADSRGLHSYAGLTRQYLRTVSTIISRLNHLPAYTPGTTRWKAWSERDSPTVYARRRVPHLGRRRHPLVAFLRAYPYTEGLEVELHCAVSNQRHA